MTRQRSEPESRAPWEAAPKVLGAMRVVMWYPEQRVWHAMAHNCAQSASHADAVTAMEMALALRDGPPRRERRRLEL